MRLSSLVTLPTEWTAHGLRFSQGESANGDVRIVFGPLPEHLSDAVLTRPRCDVRPGDWLLRLGPGMRLRARLGHSIEVDAPAAADPTTIVAWLLGAATTAILYQRGLTPLHASAVLLDGGVVAFLARSGMGKSSMAAAFAAEGVPLVTDDVLAVQLDDRGTPVAWPGGEGLRLLRATRASFPTASFTTLRADVDDKLLLATTSRLTHGPVPLRALFLLAYGEGVCVERMKGLELFLGLRRLVQRPALAAPIGAEPALFPTLSALAARVPAYRLTRPHEGWTLAACSELANHTLTTCPSPGLPMEAFVDARPTA